jgi:hypothetical protein
MFDDAVCFIVNVKHLEYTYFFFLHQVSYKSLDYMEKYLKPLFVLSSNFLNINLELNDITYSTVFIPNHTYQILKHYNCRLIHQNNTIVFTTENENQEMYSEILFECDELVYPIEKTLYLHI